MRRFLASLALLAIASSAPGKTAAETPPRHVIAVELDPAAGTLSGTDTLTLPWRRSVDLLLHDGLKVTAVSKGKALTLKPAKSGEAGRFALALPSSCKDADGTVTVAFTLQGRIADPVENEPSLHFVTGDRTRGLISEQGAFLAGGTGWYAETGDLALFDVAVTVPAAWSVVSQGDRHPAQDAEGGKRTFRYDSAVPSDGLALSAGPYVVTSVEHEGITISTWLWAEDQPLSETFLEAAKKEISRLTARLGKYPGTKFDIVENFFTTGYGFPTYTLLGSDVIKMGPRALRPGYLDHEIAHVWFGNHVNVDPSGGNWCEGLTSYVTNYLNTAAGGEQAALEARQRVSQRYSVDVPPEKDYAPKDFVTKTDDAGASVGYGKVSMIFRLLERDFGQDAVWAALKDLVARFGGKRASWSDVEDCFSKATGKDLGAFFAQWTGRAGLPQLALENVRDENGVVRGEIVQQGEPWSLGLDVQVTTINGATTTTRVETKTARTPFEIPVTAHAQRVTLDPGFDVPRRIAPQDLPPSLARTLAATPLMVIHPNTPEDIATDDSKERQRKLEELAKTAAGVSGKAVPAKDVAQAELDASSVLIIGRADENGWLREYADEIEAASGVDVSRWATFRAGDRRWRSDDAGLLVTIPHPKLPGATLSAWVPIGPEAVEAGRMIFFYGWDTRAAIAGGRARDRATTWPERSATSVVLAEPAAPGTPAARMRATIASMTRPDVEGRNSGAYSMRAGERLAKQLTAAGVRPFGADGLWADPFQYLLVDLPGRPALRYMPKDAQSVAYAPVIPATAWLPTPSPEQTAQELGMSQTPGRVPWVVRLPAGLVFVGGPKPDFTGLDLKDAAAVVLDDGSPGARDRIAAWIDATRLRNGAALIVLRPDAAWPGEPGLVVAASQRDRSNAGSLAALEKQQGFRALERLAARERALLGEGPQLPKFPLFFAGPELAAVLKDASGMRRGARTLAGPATDLRLSIGLQAVNDANVLGVVPGTSAAFEPAVMLSAHVDGLGEQADGTFQQGAASDAAGCAVVLEVASRLAASPCKYPVVVALFSGTEWGLQGSRSLAARWTGDRPSLRAMIDVQAAGHAGAPMRLVGSSRRPELAAILDGAAQAEGLKTGDAAVRDGDGRPWAAKDVPAVGVLQADEATIGGPDDTTDKLDDDTLERMANALEAAVRRIANAD